MDLNEDAEKTSWSCWLWTLFAAKGALFAFCFMGIHEGQSAVLIPQLRSENRFNVTQTEEAWIASLGILTAPLSALLSGPFIDAFGRNAALQLFYLIMGLGFAITATAREVYQIFIGRTVCAFAAGVETCVMVYISEISTEKQRNAFFSILSLMINSGTPLSYIINGYLPWNLASAILSGSCFIFFIAECFNPESPAWLFKMGRQDAAIVSLRRLRRSEPQIDREIEHLKLSSHLTTEKVAFSTFLQPTVWKPFLILVVFHILRAATGANDILYYMVDFIERLGTTYDPLAASVLLSMSRFLSSAIFGTIFKTAVGRKPATAISSLLMTTTLSALGVYEYTYQNIDTAKRPYQWLPLALLVGNLIGCTLGMTTLPWLMSGELFPLKVRGSMAGASSFVGFACSFVSVEVYFVAIDALAIYGLLFVFAGASFVAIFFAVFVLPETQDKSLIEIERGFLPKEKEAEGNEKLLQMVE